MKAPGYLSSCNINHSLLEVYPCHRSLLGAGWRGIHTIVFSGNNAFFFFFSLGALLNPLVTDVQSVIVSTPLHLINGIALAFCFGQDEPEWEVKGVMVMKCVDEGHNQSGSA